MTYLTPHFTLEELCSSETAERYGIDNTPPEEVRNNLRLLALSLEKVRTLLGGKPIHVTSAYRNPEVNRIIGSKPTSDHIQGLAADFVCPTFGGPDYVVRTIMASDLPYKQVIREFDRWTHFSIPAEEEEAKREALIIDKTGTRTFIV